jgi:hypothetical protein
MMQRPQAALHVGPGAHFPGRAHQDADPAGVHRVEQIDLGEIAVGIMNKRDRVFANAVGGEPRAYGRKH